MAKKLKRRVAHLATGKKTKCRLRKWICPKCGQILRVASDTLQATHDPCERVFIKVMA